MNYSFKINSKEEISTLRKRVTNYFLAQKFVLSKNKNNMLEFKRGNKLLNMVTFNPLQWKSVSKINFNGDEIVANFSIDTSFQQVMSKEKALWETYIGNLQTAIVTGDSVIDDNHKKRKETMYASWKFIGKNIFIGIAVGLIILTIRMGYSFFLSRTM